MSIVLIPIIKDKKAKISSIDNYRPVAIASVVSKVVERILLDRLSEYLDTMGNQFGFKPKLGTDMCIYSLKEIIGSCRRELHLMNGKKQTSCSFIQKSSRNKSVNDRPVGLTSVIFKSIRRYK